MGLILDQIVEGICVTVREPPKWLFWSASIPLFCWFYSLFLYNHSFIFFFYLFFYFLHFFSCDLNWRSRRELYCLIVWMVRLLRVNILCIYVFLYFFIRSFISFIFVFHLPSWAWGLCLQSEAGLNQSMKQKIFSTFLIMLPLKNPLRNLDGFCLLVCLFLLAIHCIQLLKVSFEVTVIYIEFALRCWDVLVLLNTFHFNVDF